MSFIHEFIILGKIPFTNIVFNYESFLSGVLAFFVTLFIAKRAASIIRKVRNRAMDAELNPANISISTIRPSSQ